MIKNKVAAFAAATAMFASVATVQAFAESSVAFTPSVSAASVNVGDMVTVTVNLTAGGDGVAAWSSSVTYDASGFAFESGTALEQGALISPTGTGASWFGTENSTYSGAVYSVTFRALAAGTYTFDVGGMTAYDANEQAVPYSGSSVSVVVTDNTASSEAETSSEETASSESDSSSVQDTVSEADTSSETVSSSTPDSSSTASSSTASSSTASSSTAATGSSASSSKNSTSSSAQNSGKTDNPKTGAAAAGVTVLLALGLTVVARKSK